MSFIRCDRGSQAADPHTLAMALGPSNRYAHSASSKGSRRSRRRGEYLREQGYFRSWGIGRHIRGSQLFDYWRDPDGFLVEHCADGDMFRQHPRTRMGAVHRVRAGPMGPSGHRRLIGHPSPPRPGRGPRHAHCAARPQRVRHHPSHRPAEGSQVMTISVLRTTDAWGSAPSPAPLESNRYHRGHHGRPAGRPARDRSRDRPHPQPSEAPTKPIRSPSRRKTSSLVKPLSFFSARPLPEPLRLQLLHQTTASCAISWGGGSTVAISKRQLSESGTAHLPSRP